MKNISFLKIFNSTNSFLIQFIYILINKDLFFLRIFIHQEIRTYKKKFILVKQNLFPFFYKLAEQIVFFLKIEKASQINYVQLAKGFSELIQIFIYKIF